MKQLLAIFLLVAFTTTAYGQTATPSNATAPTATSESKVKSEEALPPGNVSLDFKEADIKSVLRVISLKSGVNIVAGPEVTGTVSIRLQNVPWERALEVVLKTYGYVFEREGNIVRVTTQDKLALEALESRAYILNYTKADEVAEAITELLTERGRVKPVQRTNTIIVTDVASNLYKVSQVIQNLDRRTPQAYIDSKVIATQLDKTENLGINWNVAGTLTGTAIPTTFPLTAGDTAFASISPFRSFLPIINGAAAIADPVNPRGFVRPVPAITAGSANFNFGRLDFTAFSAVLNMLKTRGNTKIVSNPRIVVLNNQTAKIQVGQEIGIPEFELNEQTGTYVVTDYEMRDVGVVLNVTPHINSANEILVEVTPEVSSFVGFVAIGGTNLASPQFNTTEAMTQVLIKDGETIAIGGLLTDNRATTHSRVPILGDIPWVGNIFRSKREVAGTTNSKVETIFFITVSIVDTEGQPVREISPTISTVSSAEAAATP